MLSWLLANLYWLGTAIILIATTLMILAVLRDRPGLLLGAAIVLLIGAVAWLLVATGQVVEADHLLLKSRAERAGKISAVDPTRAGGVLIQDLGVICATILFYDARNFKWQ